MRLPFSSLRSELGISVLRAKSTTSLQKVNRSVLHNHFTVSTLQKKSLEKNLSDVHEQQKY